MDQLTQKLISTFSDYTTPKSEPQKSFWKQYLQLSENLSKNETWKYNRLIGIDKQKLKAEWPKVTPQLKSGHLKIINELKGQLDCIVVCASGQAVEVIGQNSNLNLQPLNKWVMDPNSRHFLNKISQRERNPMGSLGLAKFSSGYFI